MQNQFFTSIPPEELFSKVEQIVKATIQAELKANVKSEPEELITRKEAAKILDLSLPTLNSYTKEGLIPAYKIGSRVRYKRAEVLEALSRINKYSRNPSQNL